MESAQPALAGDHSEAAPNVKRLAGKVAIVTGAPRSIGRAIAQSLAGDGASIVVHYHSRREKADTTVAALRKSGTDATAIGGDLSDSANVAALFADTQAAFGGIDIVVANAGATTAPSPVADISDDDFDRLLTANTRATFYVLRQAARTVRDGRPDHQHQLELGAVRPGRLRRVRHL